MSAHPSLLPCLLGSTSWSNNLVTLRDREVAPRRIIGRPLRLLLTSAFPVPLSYLIPLTSYLLPVTLFHLNELYLCGRDPWYFLTKYVKTQDPVRGTRKFPDYLYLHDLVDTVLANQFVLVPKSRQMMVTWTMVALSVWRAIFEKHGVYVFLSRNERCAEELIERARFILKQLPEFMQPKLSANSRSELAFGRLDSRLISLPATPDGPRMYSPTAVFWDEMAFTPFDEQIWTALQPSLQSGGSFVGVSSSGGDLNLFARFISPLASAGGSGGVSELIPHPPTPIPSGFRTHRIHYSLHPERNEEWKAKASRGLSSRQWEREQEISFDSLDDLVYSEFDPVTHVLKEDFHPRPDWPLYRSIDFGFRKPFVLWIQKTPQNEFVVFAEWEGRDATTEQMLRSIKYTDISFGLSEDDFLWSSCDPAGAAAQDSGLSPVDFLARQGMKLCYRSSKILPGIERVKASLKDASGFVSLFISPRCEKLLRDISRYRWAVGKEEPHKDGDSDHSLDALRYFFVNLDHHEDRAPSRPRVMSW